jgi:crotonobetainyl-CoA:carnitine CoA-transferase CaiB-like acyl-CoA transferase
MAAARQGPLAGLRVIDLGTMLAGPVACTLLADFGAEVIKVEQPGTGDTLRHIGPFLEGESLFWNVEARNKKSVTLNLKAAEGRELFLQLVRDADAVVENFRPGTLARLGLDYEALKAVNPRIVLLSISGFGQDGPYAGRAGYDRIALAFGGLMHITGFPDRPPVKSGVSIADYQTCLFGALSLMMALYHRDATPAGTGQHIDLALYESVFRFTDVLTVAYDRLGHVRERQGNIGLAGAPGEHFRTRDGRYLILTISNDAMFGRLCKAMGRHELPRTEKFSSHDLRWRHIHEINAIVAAWIEGNEVSSVTAALDAHGLAYAIVLSIDEIMADPHYQARGNIETVPHPRLGELRMQGVGPKFSATPAGSIAAAPALGEHTDEILTGLGLDPVKIRTLRTAGIL